MSKQATEFQKKEMSKMYRGEGFDITQEVIDYLNAAHKAKADDAKKSKK